MPKSALPRRYKSDRKWEGKNTINRKIHSFTEYSKSEDSGGQYGYHSNAQKKRWNGGYSNHSGVSNRASDVSFVDEYPYTKRTSAYQQFLKKEREKSLRRSAMSDRRRVK